jgi:twinkle protein
MIKNNNKIISKSHIPCPSCDSSDAYCMYADGHGFCFSCKYLYLPNREPDLNYTYEYLPWRGVTKSSFKFYDVKTRVSEDGNPLAVLFKYPNGSIKRRGLVDKEFIWEGDIKPVPGLFGMDKFAAGSHKIVTITEGELDAVSFHQVLRGSPVVSVQSSGSALRDCSHDIDYLRSFDSVYIAFDNDVPGRKALDSVAKLFDYNKIYVVKFSNRKDANDYLQVGEVDELKNIWHNSKKYLPETVISSFLDFKKILSEPTKEGIQYPFKSLTDMTFGIRTSECVLITAQEGVGKTEIMHTILHKLLKETGDAVGAIFLEETKKRLLQAIPSIELKTPLHLPGSGFTEDQIFDNLKDILGKDDRLHLYSHHDSDDPDVLLDTIRFLVGARGCKYVLVDHISMAVSGLKAEKDERRALDYLITRLAMLVQELDFALILVSHVNDDNLTRGSRLISKIAHVRIDATRDLLSIDPVKRRTIHLVISKNRPAWKTGHVCDLIFDPLTCTLSEIANEVG